MKDWFTVNWPWLISLAIIILVAIISAILITGAKAGDVPRINEGVSVAPGIVLSKRIGDLPEEIIITRTTQGFGEEEPRYEVMVALGTWNEDILLFSDLTMEPDTSITIQARQSLSGFSPGNPTWFIDRGGKFYTAWSDGEIYKLPPGFYYHYTFIFNYEDGHREVIRAGTLAVKGPGSMQRAFIRGGVAR